LLGVLDVRFSSVVDACPSIPELMLEVFLDVSLESPGSGDVVEVSFFSAVAMSLDSLLGESGDSSCSGPGVSWKFDSSVAESSWTSSSVFLLKEWDYCTTYPITKLATRIINGNIVTRLII
jgi:hypothetical protein